MHMHRKLYFCPQDTFRLFQKFQTIQHHIIDLINITAFRSRICSRNNTQRMISKRIPVCNNRDHKSGWLHIFPLFVVCPTNFSLGRFSSGIEFLFQGGNICLLRPQGRKQSWGLSVNPPPLERQMLSISQLHTGNDMYYSVLLLTL